MPVGLHAVTGGCAEGRLRDLRRRLLRFAGIFLLATLMSILLIPVASAQEGDDWSPASAAPGEDWNVITPKRTASAPALPRDSENCSGTVIQWTRSRDQAAVVLRKFQCDSEKTSTRVAAFMVGDRPTPSAVAPSIFGENRDLAYTRPRLEGIAPSVRFWAQGNHVIQIEVYCQSVRDDDCISLNAALSRDLASVFEHPVSTREPQSSILLNALISVFVTIPATAWVIFVALPGLVRWIAKPTFPAPDTPHEKWTNLASAVRRLKIRSFVRGGIIGLRRGLLIILAFFLAVLASPIPVPASRLSLHVAVLALIVIIPISYWASRKLVHPALLVGTEWRSSMQRGDRGYSRFVAGHILRMTSRAALVFFVAFYATIFALYFLGGMHGNRGQEIIGRINRRHEAGQQGFFDYFVANALTAAHFSAELVILLTLLVTLLLGLEQLGNRLLARSIADVTEHGEIPHVLYLRNFGDDRIRLGANRVTRRGILGRLSPWRTRKFDDVVIGRLRRIGPVIAVENPRRFSFVPTVGPAKTRLPLDNWLQWVTHHADTAAAVVVSATPKELNDGFGQELEMIARLTHRRLILVLGPANRWATTQRRWHDFCSEAGKRSLFADLLPLGFDGAAQLIAYHPQHGWTAWGGRSRSEWTFAAAIDELMKSVGALWDAEVERAKLRDKRNACTLHANIAQEIQWRRRHRTASASTIRGVEACGVLAADIPVPSRPVAWAFVLLHSRLRALVGRSLRVCSAKPAPQPPRRPAVRRGPP